MVKISSSSTKLSVYVPKFYGWFQYSIKLSVYVPKFYGWFQYDICHIARSYFFWWLGFWYVWNVHHAQCRQFYIRVSILSPICQAAYSWSIFLWMYATRKLQECMQQESYRKFCSIVFLQQLCSACIIRCICVDNVYLIWVWVAQYGCLYYCLF